MIETVAEQPFEKEMLPGILYDEVRAGYRKWLHLLCPECGVPIQLQAEALMDRRFGLALPIDRLAIHLGNAEL